ADRNRSHWSTSKTPSYTKSVSWQHHPNNLILPPVGDKRVSFVSILFFAHVGIYERDHKQTFGPGALLGDLALFYVVVGLC
ncbi:MULTISPECIES: hypothetical protein, partial [unclassified Citrobacter]|uniref:hypothetical protein n=1 Tax=unclassified Citrobacter TaxID=2644389 RepID=UPI0025775990